MSSSCVYLEKVESSVSNIAISGLAGILNIPDQTAQKIVSSAPLILFNNLEEKQAAAIVRAFSLIIEKGVPIAAALSSSRSEKPITWPQEIKVRGRSLEDYAFASLDGGFLAGGFSCPRCGEKFAIISNPLSSAATPAATVAAPAEAVVSEPVVESEPVAEEPAEEVIEEIVEEVVELPEEDEIVEEIVEVEEPVEEIVEIVEEPVAEGEDSDDVIIEEIEEVVEEVVDAPSGSDDEATVEAPAPAVNESTFETITPGSGEFSVRLKGVKGKEAKQAAAEAIQEIMGLGEKEAQKILKKVIINVVKDISEAEAEDIAAKFEAKGITAEVKAKK
jgi:ribosomal protein L7/L12